MQSARGHCRGGESIDSSPTIPVARDAQISQTLQNLHVENCIDSLTLRCEFVVHNSMVVKKKNHQHDFDLLFHDFFSVLANLSVSTLCSATIARCRTHRSMIRRL